MKKSEGKRILRRPRLCWENIIKVAIWCRCVEYFGEEICRGREHLGGPEFDGRILLMWRFGLGVYSVLMKKSEGKRTPRGTRV